MKKLHAFLLWWQKFEIVQTWSTKTFEPHKYLSIVSAIRLNVDAPTGPDRKALEFHSLHSTSLSHPLLWRCSKSRTVCRRRKNTEQVRSIVLWKRKGTKSNFWKSHKIWKKILQTFQSWNGKSYLVDHKHDGNFLLVVFVCGKNNDNNCIWNDTNCSQRNFNFQNGDWFDRRGSFCSVQAGDTAVVFNSVPCCNIFRCCVPSSLHGYVVSSATGLYSLALPPKSLRPWFGALLVLVLFCEMSNAQRHHRSMVFSEFLDECSVVASHVLHVQQALPFKTNNWALERFVRCCKQRAKNEQCTCLWKDVHF